jgi:transposase
MLGLRKEADMETLAMSSQERRRLEVLARVRRGEVTLVKASELVGLGYRQMKRLRARYRQEGDRGLVHRLRGRPSNRRRDLRRELIVALYQAHYADFGPTLATEYLAKEHGLAVAVETLRQWLLAAGLWQRRRRHPPHRRRRPRKEHCGELVQMDGSWHDWFEGRRPWATLMVMIDDATSRLYARFFEQETTAAALASFWEYSKHYGLPQALYVDRDSIYRSDREATVAEALAGQEPRTQFGRAMAELGVRLIKAHSPQAKGRVERSNGTLQDRLVKALRQRGISDLGAANVFLEEEFLAEYNERFAVAATRPADLHRKVPARLSLAAVLALHEQRQVQNDWTVRWHNRWLQIGARHRSLALAGRQVTVVEQLDGQLRLLYQGRALAWQELPGPPPPAVPPPKPASLIRSSQGRRPSPDHPWRHSPVGRAAGASAGVACSAPARSARLRCASHPSGG